MDKILDSVKDISTICKYLEAINQTTDDYMYMLDIPSGEIHIFGNIGEYFDIGAPETQVIAAVEFLSVVHTADRNSLFAGIQSVREGKADGHDMNFRMFNRRGETVWVNSRGRVLHDENGAPYVMIGRLSEEALRHLFNPLTGLWNKTKLREDLQHRLAGGGGWLMKLGIPALADISLTHGKNFGNALLCEMADILEGIDLIEESYHVDHNNFAVIIEECESSEVQGIYEQVSSALNEKCTVFAGVVPIDKSVFIDFSLLIDSANVTLSDAIQNSSGQAEFFSAEQIGKRISEHTLFEELNESVLNSFEGFEVYYQPQIKSESYELYGVEALLRYDSPKRGRVFPDEFIPILEHYGLIDAVGMWVLSQALSQCKKWRESIPTLQVAVNFSSVQFDDNRLGEKIIDALKTAGLPGSALTVELTESVQLNQNKHYYNLIKHIKSYGVRFSIDDFGTGYSNLGYLKQLDVNEIKIDRSFVSDIEKNSYNYRLISNVIEFAKTNAIDACCEGIETHKELSVLEPLQADFFQGYLFDKPCTADEIELKYIHSSSDEFKARVELIESIHSFKEQFGAIHFDPKNILHENNIGLWIIRISKTSGKQELHIDCEMARVLGTSQNLSAVECYEFWHSRVRGDEVEYVDDALQRMINGNKAVQLEYHWMHPTLGETAVRSSGIRAQDSNGMIVLEGYHRSLTNLEKT